MVTRFLILTKLMLVLQLVHEVLRFLSYQALHLWQALLDGLVPHLRFAAEEPLSIFAYDQGLKLLAGLYIEITHDSFIQA